jgi:hypothetical protein
VRLRRRRPITRQHTLVRPASQASGRRRTDGAFVRPYRTSGTLVRLRDGTKAALVPPGWTKATLVPPGRARAGELCRIRRRLRGGRPRLQQGSPARRAWDESRARPAGLDESRARPTGLDQRRSFGRGLDRGRARSPGRCLRRPLGDGTTAASCPQARDLRERGRSAGGPRSGRSRACGQPQPARGEVDPGRNGLRARAAVGPDAVDHARGRVDHSSQRPCGPHSRGGGCEDHSESVRTGEARARTVHPSDRLGRRRRETHGPPAHAWASSPLPSSGRARYEEAQAPRLTGPIGGTEDRFTHRKRSRT